MQTTQSRRINQFKSIISVYLTSYSLAVYIIVRMLMLYEAMCYGASGPLKQRTRHNSNSNIEHVIWKNVFFFFSFSRYRRQNRVCHAYFPVVICMFADSAILRMRTTRKLFIKWEQNWSRNQSNINLFLALLFVKIVQMLCTGCFDKYVSSCFSFSILNKTCNKSYQTMNCRFVVGFVMLQKRSRVPNIHIFTNDCIVYMCHIHCNNTPYKHEQNKRTLETS